MRNNRNQRSFLYGAAAGLVVTSSALLACWKIWQLKTASSTNTSGQESSSTNDSQPAEDSGNANAMIPCSEADHQRIMAENEQLREEIQAARENATATLMYEQEKTRIAEDLCRQLDQQICALRAANTELSERLDALTHSINEGKSDIVGTDRDVVDKQVDQMLVRARRILEPSGLDDSPHIQLALSSIVDDFRCSISELTSDCERYTEDQLQAQRDQIESQHAAEITRLLAQQDETLRMHRDEFDRKQRELSAQYERLEAEYRSFANESRESSILIDAQATSRDASLICDTEDTVPQPPPPQYPLASSDIEFNPLLVPLDLVTHESPRMPRGNKKKGPASELVDI